MGKKRDTEGRERRKERGENDYEYDSQKPNSRLES